MNSPAAQHDSPFDLSGKVAVVTGASSGIGKAIAIELASAGADVLIHARHSAAAARDVAAQIVAVGRGAEVVLLDLQDAAAHPALVAAAYQWRPNIDIWVNNAGVDLLTGEATGWTFEQKLEAVWRVDVVATMRLSRLVGERMKTEAGGVLLNMGWDQAQHGMAGESGELFAASKGAIMAFSKSLAMSLAPSVRVNCLAPGWIKTSWGENASEFWQRRAIRESQLGRWGTPEDVARTALFAVSPASGFLTGQTFAVNGGLLFRNDRPAP
jgi:3-oxoacyl-[acyl-carrier protein] reductase